MVDDNEDVAQSLATLLELEGHETRSAYDGAEALKATEQWHPEVILMDIGMPGMSGHEACRRIRQRDGGQQVTIIALTGWGQDGDREHSKQSGFDAHLVKPVDIADLQMVLSSNMRQDGLP